MPLVSLGSVSIGVAVPGAVVLEGIAAANVSAQVAAVATFSPSISLDFSAQLSLALDVIVNLTAALTAVPPIPVLTLTAQIALAASILIDLNATLSIVLGLANLLATAGVDLYAWDGANNALGPAVTTELGGATTHSNALILYTQSGATWTAMQGFFKTT